MANQHAKTIIVQGVELSNALEFTLARRLPTVEPWTYQDAEQIMLEVLRKTVTSSAIRIDVAARAADRFVQRWRKCGYIEVVRGQGKPRWRWTKSAGALYDKEARATKVVESPEDRLSRVFHERDLDNIEVVTFLECPGPNPRAWDDAIVGVGRRCGQPQVLVYDAEELVEILAKQPGYDHERALDFVYGQTLEAWDGDGTPVILTARSTV